MRKVLACVLLLGARLLSPVLAQPAPVPLLQLLANERPVLLDRFEPAGGPLQRFTSRPGAWYVTLFLAVPPQWPVEFVVLPRNRSHDLRVLALDTTETGEVNSATALPMGYRAAGRGHAAQYSGEFVLPAYARMDGVTLVLEQWSRSGEEPRPLWVYARFAGGHPQSEKSTAWWSPKVAPHASAAKTLVGPPSPLLSQGERRDPYEIPLQQMPSSPLLDPHSAR